MRNRAFRPFAVTLSLLLLAAVPAQAGPIQFAQVVHIIGDMQHGTQRQELRLRSVTQEPSTPVSDPASGSLKAAPLDTTASAGEIEPLSLIGETQVPQQQGGQGNVEVIEQENVEGTICDCGEIPSAGGGFPKWPLLALIPLICVTGICSGDHDTPTPTPTPTIPDTAIPEPASLLLFGSGITALAAGVRRRYAKLKADRTETTVTED